MPNPIATFPASTPPAHNKQKPIAAIVAAGLIASRAAGFKKACVEPDKRAAIGADDNTSAKLEFPTAKLIRRGALTMASSRAA
jgi:hypothetical protein